MALVGKVGESICGQDSNYRLPTTCVTHSTLYRIVSSISVSLLLLGVEDASITDVYIATRSSLFSVSGLTVAWVLGLSVLRDEVVLSLIHI